MHFFFSVGEPSGDQHAAHLIEEMRRRCPDARFSGFGGPKMQQAGCRLHYRLTDLAVMGVFEVLPLLRQFRRLVRQARRLFAEQRPDAVVLVDFPGFNWWIARAAKAAGVRVFYYLPPQLWAWAAWRIRRVRKYVDVVLCALPFEQEWYAQRGVRAELVGHPFFDDVANHPLDKAFRQPLSGQRVLGVLPGSRRKEVERNWPLFTQVLQAIHGKHPDVRFLVAAYKEAFAGQCRQSLHDAGVPLPIEFHVGKTPEIIEASTCCLMVSGSVSLEMLARRTPAAVVYTLPRLTYPILKSLVNVPWITLVNLIAQKQVLPEWVAVYRRGRAARDVAARLDAWLSDPDKLRQVSEELTELHKSIVRSGASATAAEAILGEMRPPLRGSMLKSA